MTRPRKPSTANGPTAKNRRAQPPVVTVVVPSGTPAIPPGVLQARLLRPIPVRAKGPTGSIAVDTDERRGPQDDLAGGFLSHLSSWTTSTLLHVALLLVLGFWLWPAETKKDLQLLATTADEPLEEAIAEALLEAPALEEMEPEPELERLEPQETDLETTLDESLAQNRIGGSDPSLAAPELSKCSAHSATCVASSGCRLWTCPIVNRGITCDS